MEPFLLPLLEVLIQFQEALRGFSDAEVKEFADKSLHQLVEASDPLVGQAALGLLQLAMLEKRLRAAQQNTQPACNAEPLIGGHHDC